MSEKGGMHGPLGYVGARAECRGLKEALRMSRAGGDRVRDAQVRGRASQTAYDLGRDCVRRCRINSRTNSGCS